MNQTIRPTWKTFAIAGLLAWAYFPTLGELFRKWSDEPQYSHGFLVPLFSLFLLYRNQDLIKGDDRPMPWLGYGLLVVALGLRAVAALLSFMPLDAFSLVLCLTGVVMVVGGRALLRGTWQ